MEVKDKKYLGKPVNQLDGRLTKLDFSRENRHKVNQIINNVWKTLFDNNIEFWWEFNSLSDSISLYLDEKKWDLVENLLTAFN